VIGTRVDPSEVLRETLVCVQKPLRQLSWHNGTLSSSSCFQNEATRSLPAEISQISIIERIFVVEKQIKFHPERDEVVPVELDSRTVVWLRISVWTWNFQENFEIRFVLSEADDMFHLAVTRSDRWARLT
jgi:hypothetical protein